MKSKPKIVMIGKPKEGNLSSLLNNIYLNELDKELEKRGLHFARYADDCVIFVKIKVNAEKTHITRPSNLKYLCFSFWKEKGNWKFKTHEESFKKLLLKLKKLVKRSWSVDLNYRIKKKNEEEVKELTYCRRGYLFKSHSFVIQREISNSRLKKRGLLDPLEYYLKPIA